MQVDWAFINFKNENIKQVINSTCQKYQLMESFKKNLTSRNLQILMS
jgi:hypothetical protein